MRQRAARAANLPFDTRSMPEMILAAEADGQQLYPSMRPTLVLDSPRFSLAEAQLLPMGGISNASIIYCNETGSWKFYQSDAYGFNNPSGSHTPNAIDVTLIGDSFIHGACVPAEDEISTHLRSAGHAILNLGRGASDPLSELGILVEYGAASAPPIVVWSYYEGNDLHGLHRYGEHPFLSQYLDPTFSQNLTERQAEIDDLLIAFSDREMAAQLGNQGPHPVVRFLTLFELRKLINAFSQSHVSYDCHSAELDLFEQILQRAKDEVAKWDGQLLFLYLPTWGCFAEEPNCALAKHDEIIARAAKLNLPVIDLVPIMQAHPDPLSLFAFRLNGHYTSEGYHLVANTISTWLSK